MAESSCCIVKRYKALEIPFTRSRRRQWCCGAFGVNETKEFGKRSRERPVSLWKLVLPHNWNGNKQEQCQAMDQMIEILTCRAVRNGTTHRSASSNAMLTRHSERGNNGGDAV
ncbi:hypothetical protein LINPERHAP1_LOCUS20599 [Linum perenne]